MYFPYVRGKQFDLIAIRELVEDGLLTEKIIPVVEPINLTSTLISTIKTCVDHEKRIAVIHNPQVGVFRSKYSDSNNEELKNEFNELMNDEYVLYAHILNEESKSELNDLSDMGIHGSDMLVVHNKLDYIDFYNEYFSEAPLYNLIPDDSAFRRRISKNTVLLKDNFPKKQRNADYLNVGTSIFSEDHLYYETEGYKGFSDFSIIGNDYIDSGFAPWAVAIHIVYFNKDNILKIKHFVSDSNTDISDTAGKFYEALSKLIEWDQLRQEDGIKINTKAMDELRERYHEETYPGLGYLKKLTLKHHLELMATYLSEGEE